jgi:Na+-translocating ferredoxin:NAD+ oxidoreductase RnfD subunit
VILPSIRDARLHVAAVIITIHVLGQVTLRFQVSVPQILAAILTCAVMEVAITFGRTRSFVWPASAMLTGSGVALILRVPSTPPGDHWTTHAWYVFAGVAAFSLATKYLIRYRGSHIFNPSNIGLVVTFIVFDSSQVEPLDFWWAPLTIGMVIAYAVILTGGLLITARLRLLGAAAAFWISLAAGLGVLAASGHCMVARWAFAPVCGYDYWRVIVTSPEILIFLFFMITDPKTVPRSGPGRVVFGVSVAITSILLMAPQTNEYWTKVALLGGLVVVCALRPLVDRLLVRTAPPGDRPRLVPTRALTRWPRPVQVLAQTGAVALVVVVLGAAVVIAGAPGRGLIAPDPGDVLDRVLADVDPATLPTITVDQDVVDWNHEIDGAGAQAIVLTLVQNLQLENQAVLDGDQSMLETVDHGDRLDEMRARLDGFRAAGTAVIEHYQIEDVNVTLLVPFGKQDGLSLGLETTGTVIEETYDARGQLEARTSSDFATTFAMRRATGARWLNVGALPSADS